MFLITVDSKSIKAGESTEHFDQWVRTFTGISFLVLGVSILKYGSQLETTVTHSINLKSSMAAQMEGLDIRILSITILLSLVFLSRALVDCMFAFNLINEQLNSFVILLCIIILSEVCTSMAVVKLMLKGSKQSQGEDNNYKAADSARLRSQNSAGSAAVKQEKRSKHRSDYERKTNSQSERGDMESQDSDYTSYGSFNPNLDLDKALAIESKQAQDLLTPGPEPSFAHTGSSNKQSKNYCQFLEAKELLVSYESLQRKHIESEKMNSLSPKGLFGISGQKQFDKFHH